MVFCGLKFLILYRSESLYPHKKSSQLLLSAFHSTKQESIIKLTHTKSQISLCCLHFIPQNKNLSSNLPTQRVKSVFAVCISVIKTRNYHQTYPHQESNQSLMSALHSPKQETIIKLTHIKSQINFYCLYLIQKSNKVIKKY